MDSDTELFGHFADVLLSVKSLPSRIEKRDVLGEYLSSLPDASLIQATNFLCGRPFARGSNRKLSVGGATISQALKAAQHALTDQQLAAAWLEHSDAGDAAAAVWHDHSGPSDPLSLMDAAETFDRLETAHGSTLKVDILATVFSRMDANAIRAFVKVMLSETRMGVQEKTVEEAVATMSGLSLEEIRSANRHRADLGSVAVDARGGKLVADTFRYFVPVDPMLAHPSKDTDEVLSRRGTPIWVEDKFDGVRCQLHKVAEEVRLYSRDRKDITTQFPEVAFAFAAGSGSFALDGEIMIIENGRSMPFARLQQRLNRVAPAPSLIAAHPAALVAFDVLALDAESFLERPLHERRAALESIEIPVGQQLANHIEACTAADLDQLFVDAQSRGNEGLMCKDPQSTYVSGRRGYHWLKVKKTLETLDVVIVGAEWGHGKRRAVLSDYTFAVRDSKNDRLVTIGKAYGGLTDLEVADLTQKLINITMAECGRYRTVTPQIVLEVAFNGIQKSERHKSGFALRFPRIVRIRTDKSVKEINTLEEVISQHNLFVGTDI